ncbi:zinc dependent phospholipase C family protein [Microbacterium panaciterrae]|uniref:Phospholipase C/D domain-containing protein n=1 Tax=Microbacterium panaciterrae TaxID=985759 RepID=A0ABP8PTL5_9MICO
MPGWYVHMEAAHDTAQRLRDGDVPGGFPVSAAQAQVIGEHCHTWRNYLALGSLGPDVFYLLPDFKNTTGQVIRQVVQWALDVWEVVDSAFIGKWEKWIDPISTNNSQLASQLTGGLSTQLAQVLDELTSAIMTAFKGLLAEMGDWFGVLTSGVPQGYGDDAFYWSDIFHYRRTYQFPYVLFQQAQDALAAATTDDERQDAQARIAFAVGWLSHCATDVTGHPFTNAKAGGPYRDHWQRHHLVENHMDAENYGARHPGPLYGEYGTSALHFRLAFRRRADAPYNGRDDAPAYDYWSGFPAYDNGDGPTATAHRHTFFDLDTGPLPGHLVEGLLDAMHDVYGADGPHILLQDPPFSATDPVTGQPDGRPNEAAMGEMWEIVYRYLKMTSSDAISLRLPPPPDVFTDHSFPTPPGGGGSGIDDDPSRGADVDHDDSFSLLDLLLALFAWVVYLAQVVAWLLTVLPGLIVDITTFPAREVIYWAVIVPAWNLYLLARRALVMSAVAMPKPGEINPGLTTLGREGTYDIASALDNPFGLPTATPPVTEPSGRLHSTDVQGLDHAYPRGIVRDLPSAIGRPDITGALGLTAPLRYRADAPGDEFKASEWVAPWRYPFTNQAGAGVAQEGAATHVGPYVVGSSSTILLSALAGHDGARADLEKAATPADTESRLDTHLALDQHLGGPVDYGVYLVGRMAADQAARIPEFSVPDFNLDSDRGYAWHTWDWDRGTTRCVPGITAVGSEDYGYPLPCTSPQLFHADHDVPSQPGLWYVEAQGVAVHYVPGPNPPTCVPPKTHDPNTDPTWRDRLKGRG